MSFDAAVRAPGTAVGRAAVHQLLRGAEFVPLTAPPVAGGVLRALEQLGPVAPALHERVLAEVSAQRWESDDTSD